MYCESCYEGNIRQPLTSFARLIRNEVAVIETGTSYPQASSQRHKAPPSFYGLLKVDAACRDSLAISSGAVILVDQRCNGLISCMSTST